MTLTINNIYYTLYGSIKSKKEGNYTFEIYNDNALETAYNGMHNTIKLLIKDIDKNIELIENNSNILNDIKKYIIDRDDNDTNVKIFVLQNKLWYISLLLNLIIKIKKNKHNIQISIYCVRY